MPYSPDTGYFYVPGTIRSSAFARIAKPYRHGRINTNGYQQTADGTTLTGTFTAIDGKTNKIAWQHKTPYRMGGGGGSTVTASGLLFRGAAKLALARQIPRPMMVIVRLLGGVAAGLAVYVWAFGTGGSGLGSGSELGSGDQGQQVSTLASKPSAEGCRSARRPRHSSSSARAS